MIVVETHIKQGRELHNWKRLELELIGGKLAGNLTCAKAILMDKEQAS